ncbi:Na+/H+ antiporter NhaC family protein [Peribacillus simplex]|uniref:Na+/H+ antiporter NhaC family protein n=1 Tax=Peribacillus simplex TaxID=1478 RepID=UPI0037F273FE
MLSRGGLYSLMSSFFVVLLAMCVTGILEQYGILSSLVESLVKRTLGSTFRITLATMVITLITNMIGSSMLITSIVAGSLMKNVFKNNNFPENLSRNIASVIPWKSNKIYCSQMYAYFLYVFLAFFVPLFDLVYGATGFANIVQVVTTTILYLTFKTFLAFNPPFEI